MKVYVVYEDDSRRRIYHDGIPVTGTEQIWWIAANEQAARRVALKMIGSDATPTTDRGEGIVASWVSGPRSVWIEEYDALE